MTTLLILLNICHWLGDYTHLSNMWMLKAKAKGTPLFPIFCHASIHALPMGIVLFYFGVNFEYSVAFAIFQLITHFLIDVWKGKMNVWFPRLADPTFKGHWYIFGFDQLLHQLVIILMVSMVF